MWYFVKCIYFGLSAYQIRCGYPTRVLGNFLTKSYNYVNLFLFQGWVMLGKGHVTQMAKQSQGSGHRSRLMVVSAAEMDGITWKCPIFPSLSTQKCMYHFPFLLKSLKTGHQKPQPAVLELWNVSTVCSFRLVPFLTELRAVMDWVWTDTSLSLSSWICVEDIYAHIFILKCWRESEKVPESPRSRAEHWKAPRYRTNLRFLLSPSDAEVSTTTGTEEEEGGEVRDGRDDRGAAHLYRLVPAALHVPRQVRRGSRQPTAGRFLRDHPGWFPGAAAFFSTRESMTLSSNGVSGSARFVRNCEGFSVTQGLLFPQPIFKMSAQQNQLLNVSESEFQIFLQKYSLDDVSTTSKYVIGRETFASTAVNLSDSAAVRRPCSGWRVTPRRTCASRSWKATPTLCGPSVRPARKTWLQCWILRMSCSSPCPGLCKGTKCQHISSLVLFG